VRILSVVILFVISLNGVAITLPRNPYLLFRYGQRYLKKRNYSVAISCFKKATKLGLQSPRLYSDLGRAYFKRKKFRKAITSFSQVLEMDPADCFALQMRAFTRMKRYQLVLAKRDLDTAYLLQPHSGFLCSLYGRYYKMRRQNRIAYNWFRRALNYNKDYFGYLSAGKAAFKLKFFRQARGYFANGLACTRSVKNRQYLRHMVILSFYKLAVKIKRQGRVKAAAVVFRKIQRLYSQSKYAKLAGRELNALRYLEKLRRPSPQPSP